MSTATAICDNNSLLKQWSVCNVYVVPYLLDQFRGIVPHGIICEEHIFPPQKAREAGWFCVPSVHKKLHISCINSIGACKATYT